MKRVFFDRLKYFVVAFTILACGLLFCGCDDTTTYNISLSYVSGSISVPTLSGGGTYVTGDTATLKAVGSSNCHFIGWLYQYKTLLTNGDTYKITTADDYMSSTISFTVSKSTADNYTAIFEDSSQTYYTLTAYKLAYSSDDSDEELTTDYSSQLFEGSIKIEFGDQTNTTFRTVIEESTTFYRQVKVEPSNITEVISVYNNTPSVRITVSDGSTQNITLTQLTYGQGSTARNIVVTYNSDKTYTIAYTFTFSSTSYTVYLTVSPLTFDTSLLSTESEAQ